MGIRPSRVQPVPVCEIAVDGNAHEELKQGVVVESATAAALGEGEARVVTVPAPGPTAAGQELVRWEMRVEWVTRSTDGGWDGAQSGQDNPQFWIGARGAEESQQRCDGPLVVRATLRRARADTVMFLALYRGCGPRRQLLERVGPEHPAMALGEPDRVHGSDEWIFGSQVDLEVSVPGIDASGLVLVAATLYPQARDAELVVEVSAAHSPSCVQRLEGCLLPPLAGWTGVCMSGGGFEAGKGGHRGHGAAAWSQNPQLHLSIRRPCRPLVRARLARNDQLLRFELIAVESGAEPRPVEELAAKLDGTEFPQTADGAYVCRLCYTWRPSADVAAGEYMLVVCKSNPTYSGSVDLGVLAEAAQGSLAFEVNPSRGLDGATRQSLLEQGPAVEAIPPRWVFAVDDQWEPATAGGPPSLPTWRRNPQWFLSRSLMDAALAGHGRLEIGLELLGSCCPRRPGLRVHAAEPVACDNDELPPRIRFPDAARLLAEAPNTVFTSHALVTLNASTGSHAVAPDGALVVASDSAPLRPGRFRLHLAVPAPLTVEPDQWARLPDVPVAQAGGEAVDASDEEVDLEGACDLLRSVGRFPRASVPVPIRSAAPNPSLLARYLERGKIFSCARSPPFPATVLAQALLEHGKRFIDREFPPAISSLVLDSSVTRRIDASKITWRRAAEVFGVQPRLFVDGVAPGDVVQGALGNCYLISAAAAMAAADGEALRSLFSPPDWSEAGIYTVRLVVGGSVAHVTVDDYLPVWRESGTLCFSRPSQPGELWGSLLEKALAKLCGCYEALVGGWDNVAAAGVMEALGAEAQRCHRWRAGSEGAAERAWAALGDVARLSRGEGHGGAPGEAQVGILHSFKRAEGEVASPGSKPADSDAATGLVGNHDYSVLGRLEAEGERLVLLRNPHGRGEWRGAFSDTDAEHWTDRLRAETQLEKGDDGSFWMRVGDVAQLFGALTAVQWRPRHVCSAIQVPVAQPEGGAAAGEAQLLVRLSRSACAAAGLGRVCVELVLRVEPLDGVTVVGVEARPVGGRGSAGGDAAEAGAVRARSAEGDRVDVEIDVDLDSHGEAVGDGVAGAADGASYERELLVIARLRRDGDAWPDGAGVRFRACHCVVQRSRGSTVWAQGVVQGAQEKESERVQAPVGAVPGVGEETAAGVGCAHLHAPNDLVQLALRPLTADARTSDARGWRAAALGPEARAALEALALSTGGGDAALPVGLAEPGGGGASWTDVLLGGGEGAGPASDPRQTLRREVETPSLPRAVRVVQAGRQIRAAALMTRPQADGDLWSCRERFAACIVAAGAEGHCLQLEDVTVDDLRGGRLTRENFDVFVCPGGMAPAHRELLGDSGAAAVVHFVREQGGGYVGVCAGAFLGSTVPELGMLGLLPVQPVDRAHWRRGWGDVDVRLTSAGQALIGGDVWADADGGGGLVVRFARGPLLRPLAQAELEHHKGAPADATLGSGVVPLLGFGSEFAEGGSAHGTMVGEAACWYGISGKGRAVLLAPHPEYTGGQGAGRLLARLIALAAAEAVLEPGAG